MAKFWSLEPEVRVLPPLPNSGQRRGQPWCRLWSGRWPPLQCQLLLSGDALHADQDIQLDRVGLNPAFTMAVNTGCTLVVLIVHTIAPGAPPGGEPAASEGEAGHGEPSSHPESQALASARVDLYSRSSASLRCRCWYQSSNSLSSDIEPV